MYINTITTKNNRGIFKESCRANLYFMNKFYVALISILFLTNCSAPTASLFGPVFTGAKTGSLYQASLSYGSNRILNEIKEYNFNAKETISEPLETTLVRMPKILSTFTVSDVEFSDPIEPEPLP